MRLLIVEDDQVLSGLLKHYLGAGYILNAVKSIVEAKLYLEIYYFQGLILDLHLPDGDALFLAKQLRKAGVKTPILLISASNNQKIKMSLLGHWVDDYLAKPFSLNELEARILALLRRSEEQLKSSPLVLRDLSIDFERKIVFYQQKHIALTKKEFLLLEELVKNRGRILAKKNLANKLWRQDQALLSNTLAAHISKLRKKIDYPLIKTVRGLGYRIED